MTTLKGFRSILAVGALTCCSSIAFADPIAVEFEIGGFAGGATVSGSFSGNDANGSGVLGASEVSAFSLTWSGNSRTRSFSHSFSDLRSLIYNITGDRLFQLSSGNSRTSASYTDFLLFRVSNVDGPYRRDSQSTFRPRVTTTSVPEPGTLTLFGMGLLAIGFASRRRRPIG